MQILCIRALLHVALKLMLRCLAGTTESPASRALLPARFLASALCVVGASIPDTFIFYGKEFCLSVCVLRSATIYAGAATKFSGKNCCQLSRFYSTSQAREAGT
jgi:hypothetical protein